MRTHPVRLSRRRVARAALALACVGLFAAVAAVLAFPAHAKVPGLNGVIAFTRTDFSTGHDTTYIVNPDGSHLQALLPGVDTGAPHWSPNGSKLALQGEDTPCPPCSPSTIILNPDTGQKRVLSPPDVNFSIGCGLWSPDASRFACSGESDDNPSVNGVYTIRTKDGGGLTRITDAGGGGLMDIPIDYSPDGTRLVFGRVSSADHSCTTRSALYVVDIDGSGLHRITPWGFCDDDGSWSPDGSEIAFAAGGPFTRIFVVHPDGSGLTQIPVPVTGISGLADVGWSPDGSRLVFSLGSSQGLNGIFTANADGGGLQQLTSSSAVFDHEADWGPHPISP